MDIWSISAVKLLSGVKMENREPIKIIADLLSHELDMTSERIYLYNDGRPLPRDIYPYLVISINNTQVFSNNSIYMRSVDKEKFSQNFKQDVIVSVISKDKSARTLANRVVMALTSIYSQQLQEKYSCHIARIGHMTDASFLEETDMLTRMDVSVNVISWDSYEKSADYYEVEDYDTMFES